MKIIVKQNFINYRTNKAVEYNQTGRSDDQFLRNLDCELYEFERLQAGSLISFNGWKADGTTLDGENIDVKFIETWFNVSDRGMDNLKAQEGTVDKFQFMEWTDRPNRPLVVGDEVSMEEIGSLTYDEVVHNLVRSNYGGFYVKVRQILNRK